MTGTIVLNAASMSTLCQGVGTLDELTTLLVCNSILSLLKFLENLEPQGTDTDLARVVTGFVHREQRRGLAVVISDLYDPAGFEIPITTV